MSVVVHRSIAAAVAAARHTAVRPLTWNPVEHLLSRFSFGPDTASRAYVRTHGYDAWYRTQIALAARYPGYAGNTAVAKATPLLTRSPQAVRAYLKARGNEFDWDAMDQLSEATLGLQAWSAAQLYETLVDFFSNHLNVANHNGDVWVTRHAYDRDVIRRHATGSFRDMLVAAGRHPAMLQFLNLAQSTRRAVNENYGRELLELHTVGLHYSESDVKNTAKLLTGRTVDDATQAYVYDPDEHPTGAVRVLGFTHANSSTDDGRGGGDALLTYLARHALTAAHLARKLCMRFVSDTPSAGLVDAVARAYLSHDTQILPMVSTILRTTEFWEARGRKVRRPAENLIATMRVLGIRPTDTAKAIGTLHWMTRQVGHLPLEWPAPNGYPDVAAAWRSSGTLLLTWRAHLGYVGGWWDGLPKVNVARLYGSARTSGQAVTALTHAMTQTPWPAASTAALQHFLGEPAATPIHRSRLRWLDGPLLALVLDSPHHALR